VHHYFNLLPHTNNTNVIHRVRQEAIDVCSAYREFCETREEIHAFPTRQHLKDTEALFDKTQSETVKRLRDSLREFFGHQYDYSTAKAILDQTALKDQIAAYFLANRVYTIGDIASLSLAIHRELVAHADDLNYKEKFLVELLALQSYLKNQFKHALFAADLQSIAVGDIAKSKEFLSSLIQMSQAHFLLTRRESTQIEQRIALAKTSGELKQVIKDSIQFQVARVSATIPTFYGSEEILQEAVRTSTIADWDLLLRAFE
jgi:uncharacterized protein (DUF1697 family)